MNGVESTMTKKTTTKPSVRKAEIVKEFLPAAGHRVHGVTFDGKLVWYASDTEIIGIDPESGAIARRLTVPADAGTAWDGTHFYQLSGAEILVVRAEDGRVLRRLPAPGKRSSGLAYADGHLWVGQWSDAKIHKIDVETGAIVKTLSSDRFVTGVSVVDGALWHGGTDDTGKASELRRLAEDGTVEEVIAFEDPAMHLAGVEGDGRGGFWCGGEGGKIRHVRAKL